MIIYFILFYFLAILIYIFDVVCEWFCVEIMNMVNLE